MPVSEEIERAFDSGATVIPANARAARWLQREYAVRQRRAGRRAWETPPVLDWESWLRQQWQAHALAEPNAPLLLTTLQERSVWTRMLREDAALVVSPGNLAALAESAYALLSAYEAHRERNNAWGKADAERFRKWAAAFDRECARNNWMPRAGLEQTLAARLGESAGLVSGLGEILLVGFDRTTPAQEKLLRTLGERGARVRFVQAGGGEAQLEFLRADGLHEEITACARWARGILEKNSEARIGVLVPDLGAVQAEIARVFRRELMPQSDNIFSDAAMPFEFSLGQPLGDVPVVHAALLLLRWLRAPLREEELSWLLFSGFLPGDGAERLALAGLDAKARNSGMLSLEISLETFLREAYGSRLTAIARLENARRAAAANRLTEEDRLPGRWTDIAQMLLLEAGWPGEEHAGSLHFQALRRWERALDELALLDFNGQRIGYEDFLRALEAHALETIFAPESQGAPVQVMGALEASGQQFDAVWFLGADDASWPPRGRAHPLLPSEAQRRYGMPHGDAGNDLELAKAVTARIAASAPAAVFSYAKQNKDGELRGSPLLPLDATWRDAAPEPEAARETDLEDVEDAAGQIAWPRDRSPVGSEVLKDQAACPFRAFAAKRLRAEPLNRREWGLSAAERGKRLHQVLEAVWSPTNGALHSLDDLRAALNEGRLSDILRAAIAGAFAELEQRAEDDAWMLAYLQQEQRRLLARLTEWMKEEAKRVPFKVSAVEERLHDVDVGGLKLKLIADRIDEVAGGERLLIDYKSGEVGVRDWELPRPNEPQLPLYAVFGNVVNVRGALFARIRAGEACFTGSLADVNRQLFADMKATAALGKLVYDERLRDAWEDALLALAEEFLRGEAIVNPKDGPATCKHCALPGLCRVAELRNAPDGAEEDCDDRG